ncbi:hypothetical protein N4R57_18825 [Rhodobacteraceae bacterium D3-12]|nr:hypothetical protein N4R57_18825 [Rhodobacteraceae bacterium D3-12]
MIRAILHWAMRGLERRYAYDAAYAHHVINVSRSAGIRLAMFPLVAQYRGPKPGRLVWAGALFGSTHEGDCGPCAQLVVDMAVEAGVPVASLRACAEGRAEEAGDVGLGYRFAMAAIADTPEAAALGDKIAESYGEDARVAASFAAATGRFYPVFKRGLGHGQLCAKLRFDGAEVAVTRKAG